jgi:hypothetical protein
VRAAKGRANFNIRVSDVLWPKRSLTNLVVAVVVYVIVDTKKCLKVVHRHSQHVINIIGMLEGQMAQENSK